MNHNNLFDLRARYDFLIGKSYVKFFIVGASGAAINLLITAGLTEFLFGRENYFYAYLIGLAANLIYNFILHTVATFKTQSNHSRRLVSFIAYSLIMTFIQTQVVRYLTDFFGVNWYLVIIASVTLGGAVITFVVFRFIIFRKPRE